MPNRITKKPLIIFSSILTPTEGPCCVLTLSLGESHYGVSWSRRTRQGVLSTLFGWTMATGVAYSLLLETVHAAEQLGRETLAGFGGVTCEFKAEQKTITRR